MCLKLYRNIWQRYGMFSLYHAALTPNTVTKNGLMTCAGLWLAPWGGHSFKSAKSQWWYTHFLLSHPPINSSAAFSNINDSECQLLLGQMCFYRPPLTLEIINWINPLLRAAGTKRTLFPITSQDWSFVWKKPLVLSLHSQAHAVLFSKKSGPATISERVENNNYLYYQIICQLLDLFDSLLQ